MDGNSLNNLTITKTNLNFFNWSKITIIMREIQYKEYGILKKRFEQVERELANLKSKSSSEKSKTKYEDGGWVKLSYGNGTWDNTILSNKESVKKISLLIINLLEDELEQIEAQMKEI